mmetsp:Transcript_91841/g.230781  ORF Transcript_91841/g.230781 Transcript_91841/m.230781 type:complete len:229 (-) Transcript_91841:999-1685(-)
MGPCVLPTSSPGPSPRRSTRCSSTLRRSPWRSSSGTGPLPRRMRAVRRARPKSTAAWTCPWRAYTTESSCWTCASPAGPSPMLIRHSRRPLGFQWTSGWLATSGTSSIAARRGSSSACSRVLGTCSKHPSYARTQNNPSCCASCPRAAIDWHQARRPLRPLGRHQRTLQRRGATCLPQRGARPQTLWMKASAFGSPWSAAAQWTRRPRASAAAARRRHAPRALLTETT